MHASHEDGQRPSIVCANLILDTEQLLLVKEAKASALGRWSLPGGRLEPGETLQQGAEREALEETGLVVEVRELLGIYHCLETLEGGAALNFVFRSTVVSGEMQSSDRQPEVAFLPLPEIDALLARNMIRGSHVRLALAAAAAGTCLPDGLISVVPASPPPFG